MYGAAFHSVCLLYYTYCAVVFHHVFTLHFKRVSASSLQQSGIPPQPGANYHYAFKTYYYTAHTWYLLKIIFTPTTPG